MRIVSVICVAATLAVAPASGQVGLFSQGGLGGFLNFQTGDNYQGIGLQPSYVVNPMFEAAVNINRVTPTCDGCDGGSWYFTPTVYVYALRETESMPVTVYGTGYYHFVSTDDAPDGTSSSGWGAGAGVSKKLSLTETLNVTPVFELTYTSFTHETAAFSITSNPLYYMVALLGSMEAGPGTLFFGPLFEGYSEDGHSGSQIGVRVGLAMGK